MEALIHRKHFNVCLFAPESEEVKVSKYYFNISSHARYKRFCVRVHEQHLEDKIWMFFC